MATINKLSATQVRQAKFTGKPYKLHDGGGLSLRVRKSGTDWVLRYMRDRRSREMTLGKFPAVPLADARRRRDEARAMLADGLDPLDHKREQAEAAKREAERSTRTLRRVATEWMDTQQWSPGYRATVEARLHKHVYPRLGDRPLEEITAPEILATLRVAEEAGRIEVAPRCRQYLSGTFTFAIASGWVDHNPAAGLGPALKKAPPTQHRAAVLDPDRLGDVLRAIETYEGQPQVNAALQLIPMVMTRPGELRNMEWAEVDFDAALWSIPARKMKMRQDHMVPLPRQAVEILRELHEWTGHRALAFPGLRSPDRPISDMAMNAAFRRLGFRKDEVTAHGFRATARTMLAERLRWPAHIIELQLAHAPRDPLGRAYNRADFIEDRREMLQAWADYLDGLRSPGDE